MLTIDDLRNFVDYPCNQKTDPYDVMSELVNRYGASQSKRLVAKIILQEHRTLQQNVMRDIVLPLLQGWALMYNNDMYDPRNEGTCKLAAKLVECYENSNIGLPFI